MSYKLFRTREEIMQLRDECGALTANFTELDDKAYAAFPKLLLLIRLACGMPQKKFAASLGVTRSALAHWELGISKKLEKPTRDKTFDKVKELFATADFSKQNVAGNYELLINLAKRGQPSEKLTDYRRKATKGRILTRTEEMIEKILKELKIEHEIEGVIKLGGLPYSFEFVIPNSKEPKAIVECKAMATKSKLSSRIIAYRIAYEIGYKNQLIRKETPGTRFILILFSELRNLPLRPQKIMETESVFLHNPNPEEIKSLLGNLR